MYKTQSSAKRRTKDPILISQWVVSSRFTIWVNRQPGLNSNSNVNLFSLIKDSIALAVDTGISDIIITGDFNWIMLSQQTSRKIAPFFETYSLSQIIIEPTHFTEPSSSLIYLLVVSNKDHVLLSAVGDPFLTQQVRYHCPICGIFKFSKPKKN